MQAQHGDFVWYDLVSSNAAASKKFYSSLFGWTIGSVGGPYEMIRKDESNPRSSFGCVVPRAAGDAAASRWVPYVNVNGKLEDWKDALADQGAKEVKRATAVPGGRFNVMRDPSNAEFGLFEAAKEDPKDSKDSKDSKEDCTAGTAADKDKSPHASTVGWAQVYTPNGERAYSFYSKVFGWQLCGESGAAKTDGVWSHNGKPIFAGWQQYPFKHIDAAQQPAWVVYFKVNNVEAMVARAMSLGATVQKPIENIPVWGSFAVLTDVTGATFALFQDKDEVPRALPPMKVADPWANLFCWYDLMTPNPQASSEFYGALLGWHVHDMGSDMGGYRMITVGADKKSGGVGGLLPLKPEDKLPSHWVPYIQIALDTKLEDVAAKAIASGAKQCVPPTAVPQHGRFNVMAGPDGAVFSLWETVQTPELAKWYDEQLKKEAADPFTKKVSWHELLTSDSKVSNKFYSTVFGWKEENFHGAPVWSLPHRPAYCGHVPVPTTAAGKKSSQWIVYFTVRDVDAVYAKALELGAKAETKIEEFPGIGRFATLSDPQGASFAIFTPAKKTEGENGAGAAASVPVPSSSSDDKDAASKPKRTRSKGKKHAKDDAADSAAAASAAAAATGEADDDVKPTPLKKSRTESAIRRQNSKKGL